MSKICCVTGHRKIERDKIIFVTTELKREILAAINDGYDHFISGFAEGCDLIFASIIADLKTDYSITLEAAIPYPNRMKTPDTTFRQLIKFCDDVKIHSDKYLPSCFMTRNIYMIQQSDRVIAVYDSRSKGGTFATLHHAHRLGKHIKLIEI